MLRGDYGWIEVVRWRQDRYYEEKEEAGGVGRRLADVGRSRTQEADRGKRSRQNPFRYVGMLTVHGGSVEGRLYDISGGLLLGSPKGSIDGWLDS